MKLSRGLCTQAATALVALAIPAAAQARDIVVPNYSGSGEGVTIVDASTGATVHKFSFASGGPYLSAVTPDGRTALIVDYDTNSVRTINLSTYAVSSPVQLPGQNPLEIAIAPNGERAYVAEETGGLTSFDIATGTAGPLIPAGLNNWGVAITPDGKTAYVTDVGSLPAHAGQVIPIDLATNTPGAPIPLPGAEAPAVTPNGATVWVQSDNGSIVPISTATNTAGSPISIPNTTAPSGFSISPDGTTGFATDAGQTSSTTGALDQIDLVTKSLTKSVLDANGPEWPAVMPDGKTVFTSNWGNGTIVPFSTSTLGIGTPINSGVEPGQLGVVPNQAPRAAFSASLSGATVHVNASKSSDSDGTVAEYEWSFGDGKKATTSSPKTSHRYAKAGRYKVTLTVVDNEGCSTQLVYTGQETSCTGSKGARTSHSVKLTPVIKIASAGAVKNGSAKIGLSCRGTGPCAGTLTLRHAGQSIGKAHFSIRAGGHATVSVRLNSSGRHALTAGGGRLTVSATAAVRAGRTTRRTVTLSAAHPAFTG